MPEDYWVRQSADQPLFPGILWSRPENRSQAGKLAIIGGNLHSFAAPAEAYTAAEKAGIGVARVLLPEPLSKLTGRFFDNLEYAPGNPSGSFSRHSLAQWLELAHWSDGTLLAGDLGRNSETAIVFESFVQKHSGQLTITKDAISYALNAAPSVLNRHDTTLVLSLSQLQQYAMAAGSTTPITLGMSLIQLVDVLRWLTTKFSPYIVTKYHDTTCVAVNGIISTTPAGHEDGIWRVQTAATTATWQLQLPSQPFEAITTAISQLGTKNA